MKIAHQPKSLLIRAIQVLAKEALLGTAYALAFPLPEKKIYDIKWTAKNLPSEIQHHLVQHYSGNNLTECIAGHESIQNYQNFCICKIINLKIFCFTFSMNGNQTSIFS
jgi:hypothetical protein